MPRQLRVENTQDAMNRRSPAAIRIFCGLALLLFSSGDQLQAQNKKTNCGHPPKMLSQPRFSDEDKTKWKGKSIAGRVAMIVSEQGDVARAQVLSASPREAAEPLLTAAKQTKFEPRPGCGELKIQIDFNLHP